MWNTTDTLKDRYTSRQTHFRTDTLQDRHTWRQTRHAMWHSRHAMWHSRHAITYDTCGMPCQIRQRVCVFSVCLFSVVCVYWECVYWACVYSVCRFCDVTRGIRGSVKTESKWKDVWKALRSRFHEKPWKKSIPWKALKDVDWMCVWLLIVCVGSVYHRHTLYGSW